MFFSPSLQVIDIFLSDAGECLSQRTFFLLILVEQYACGALYRTPFEMLAIQASYFLDQQIRFHLKTVLFGYVFCSVSIIGRCEFLSFDAFIREPALFRKIDDLIAWADLSTP